jgi:hypothetical protein
MKKQLSLGVLLLTLLLLGAVAIAYAQVECEASTNDVVEIVNQQCGGIGRDEVCYGNYEVSVVAQAAAPVFTFANPGDLAALGSVRSLFLSGLDPVADVWGIAQMRLIAATNIGTQDVTLLLFGDVSIESEVESGATMDVLVGNFGGNIRNTPSANALVLASAPAATTLEAVGRLADSSWVRVRVPNSEAIGWVSTEVVTPASADQNFDILAVQDSSTPYFGAMQAFSYISGSSPSCGNMQVDGLIIQTPSGNARVNLLINEVSIELIGGNNGATAFVTANASNGMSINMIDGTSVVSSGGTSYFVDATTSTNIPMSTDMTPTGTPSVPTTYDLATVEGITILGVVRDPDAPIVPTSGTGGNGGQGSGGNGGQGGNGNGRGNGNANGRGNGRGNGGRP